MKEYLAAKMFYNDEINPKTDLTDPHTKFDETRSLFKWNWIDESSVVLK